MSRRAPEQLTGPVLSSYKKATRKTKRMFHINNLAKRSARDALLKLYLYALPDALSKMYGPNEKTNKTFSYEKVKFIDKHT